jgi:hypothetical protein
MKTTTKLVRTLEDSCTIFCLNDDYCDDCSLYDNTYSKNKIKTNKKTLLNLKDLINKLIDESIKELKE